ncbi:hypothetical protein EGH21_04795 [Halomicroarcula sp. F13]|uniref:Uncharacterized protein n=1 Tax=Haloarcula rubra TaxID=2487747 RepID=A0AAW4PPN9_9EURY|nr:hypothetical protein [Halomicroarcula rubra]MBX0322347.1 hypothetical protein [Halomicroarcula rubra]
MALEFAHSPLLTFLLGLIAVIGLLVWLELPAFVGLFTTLLVSTVVPMA